MKLNKWILPAFLIVGILAVPQFSNAAMICRFSKTEEYELYDAVRYKGDNLAFIKFCCEELRGCIDGYKGEEGYSLTHAAAKYKKFETLKYLVEEEDIPVERWRYVKGEGWVKEYTQLMEASKNGDLKISKYLISKGAKITLKNEWNRDSKYYAENAPVKDPGFLTYMKDMWNKAMGIAEVRVKQNKDNLIKQLTLADIQNDLKSFKRSIKFNGFLS